MKVIKPFVGSEATDGELRQAHRLLPAFEHYADQMRQPRNYIGRRNSFAAWDGENLGGLATASFPEHEDELMSLLDVSVGAV